MHGGLANGLKKSDDWFDLVVKTMIYNFELLYTNIYQPQNLASFVAYYLYNKLAKSQFATGNKCGVKSIFVLWQTEANMYKCGIYFSFAIDLLPT